MEIITNVQGPFLTYAAMNVFCHAMNAGLYRSSDVEEEVGILEQVIPQGSQARGPSLTFIDKTQA
jgi:hypothetical protein